jgi:TP901 family phage tail tape measure protein
VHPNIMTAGVKLVPNATGFAPAAIAQVTPQMRQVNTAMASQSNLMVHASKGVRDYQRGIIAATLSVAGLRGAVLAAGIGFLGGAGLITGVRMFLGLSAGFERTLNSLQAVTHATAAQMAEASQEAVALGRDIRLPNTSAKDAAESMTELARGGLTVEEAMKAARGSLQLAAAAGTDFATAAQIEARTLNAFALGGEQAGRVADILANAANISTGEITDMALSLQQAAAVAHSMNFSVKETATAISILANAGLTGSDAGTSLRTTLLRLNPVTKKARDEMNNLGVKTTDINGDFLPLVEIVHRFHDALAKLTPEQRANSLQIIFGQDAIRASNILFTAGAKVFDQTSKALNRQGAAAQIAAAKNKGLAGTFDALKSNVESILIGFGKNTLPGVTNFVRGVNQSVTGLSQSKAAAEGLRTAADAVFSSFHAIGTLVGTIAPVLGGIAVMATKVAGALGGGSIVGAIVAYKAATVAVRLFVAAQTKAIAGMSIMAAESQLVRSTQDQMAAGAGKWSLANTKLVETQIALEASIARVAASSGAQASAANAVTVSQAKMVEGIDAVVGALTGQIAAEADAVLATEELALAQTKLQNSTLLAARTSQARLAVSQAGGSVRGAGGRFISRAQVQQEAELTAGAVKAELAVTKLGTKMRAIGSSALALAGGPLGLIGIGLAAVTTAVILFGGKGKSAFDTIKDSAEGAATAISEIAAAQEDLSRARVNIKATELSVAEAKLNVQYAKGELIQATAAGSATRLRAARLALQRAVFDLQQAEKAQADAQAAQSDKAEKLEGARYRARIKRIQRQQQLISAQRKFLDQEAKREGDSSFSDVPPSQRAKVAAAALQDDIKSLREVAKRVRADSPLVAHHNELLADLEERLNRFATRKEINVILRVTRLDVGPSTKPGQESIGDARHNLLTETRDLEPKFKDEGRHLGSALARSIAEGIATDQSRAVDAMRTALARTIAEGRLQIRDSIIEAKSSLLSIGASLSDQISQIIDSGPGGQRLAQLQAQLAGRQSAGEKRRLRRDVRDAKEQLASAQGSITHIPDTLSARERAIQKKRIEAFLRPFREKVQDAEDAIKDFNTQAVIDRLEKTQEKQKAAVTKGISDIIAEFETGQITSAQATRKIAGIVGSFQPDFHVAGNKLGVAFRLGFKAEIDALVAQIKAISVPAVAKRDNKKFPGPSVVEPAQVIAQAQRDQIEAQNRLREATHKNRLAVQALTSELIKLMQKGLSPKAAEKKVRAGVNNRSLTPGVR